MAASDAQPRDRAESPLLQRGAPIRTLPGHRAGRPRRDGRRLRGVRSGARPQGRGQAAARRRRRRSDIGEQKARLLREAQAIARLSHPNVVVVHDVGSFERPGLHRDGVRRRPHVAYWLNAARRGLARDPRRVRRRRAAGSAAAHAAQLVHRDFKAENVMITGTGQVRVMDFGLARAGAAERRRPPSPTRARGARAPTRTIQVAARAAGDRRRRAAGQRAAAPCPPAAIRATTLDADSRRPGSWSARPRTWRPSSSAARSPTRAAISSASASRCTRRCTASGHSPARRMAELADNVLRGRLRAAPTTARVPGWVRRALLRGLSSTRTRAGRRWTRCWRRWRATRARAGGGTLAAPWRSRHRVVATHGAGAVARRAPTCQVGPDRFAGVWEGAAIARRAARGDRRVVRGSGRSRARAKPSTGCRAPARRLRRALVAACTATPARRPTCAASSRTRCWTCDELPARRAGTSCARCRTFWSRGTRSVVPQRGGGGDRADADRALRRRHLGRSASRRPRDSPTRAAVDALRDRLVAIKALQDAGRYAQALEQAPAGGRGPAHQVGYRPLIAEALNRLVLLHVDMHHPQDADDSDEEALWLAEASRHDELVWSWPTVEIYVVRLHRARHGRGRSTGSTRRTASWSASAATICCAPGCSNNIGVALDANGDTRARGRQSARVAAHQGARARQGSPGRRRTRSPTSPTR